MENNLNETFSGFDKSAYSRFNNPDLNRLILVEECSEVTQAVCKVERFGIENPVTGDKNKKDLEEELGQLLVMIELTAETNGLDWNNIQDAKNRKLVKMDRFY